MTDEIMELKVENDTSTTERADFDEKWWDESRKKLLQKMSDEKKIEHLTCVMKRHLSKSWKIKKNDLFMIDFREKKMITLSFWKKYIKR